MLNQSLEVENCLPVEPNTARTQSASGFLLENRLPLRRNTVQCREKIGFIYWKSVLNPQENWVTLVIKMLLLQRKTGFHEMVKQFFT